MQKISIFVMLKTKGMNTKPHSYIRPQLSALLVLGIGILLAAKPAFAFKPDSLRVADESCRFRPVQLIAPTVLITTGAIGVSNGWFCDRKNDVRDNFEDWRGDRRLKIDEYVQYLPVAAHLGLGFVGADARHPFRERIAVAATGCIIMQNIVSVTKYFVNEKRPDSNAHNSFPSGHTATAFVGAEMIRKEYGNAWGAGAYAVAGSIGFLRMYNDRHWLNDVLAGAGIGILAANAAYWILPAERKLFHWDQTTEMSILPVYNIDNHSFCLALTAVF